MNISMQNLNHAMAFGISGGLKSTQDKMERQQKCESQVSFFENQKENLKNMQCSSLEDIARKLEMFHSYENLIAAAKKEYNNSQMMHALDEAREIGEKIAEAAEELEPKSVEERRKDLAEEAAGTEENEGMLSEIMEELAEAVEEMTEELQEEMDESLQEITEETEEKLQEEAAKEVSVPENMEEQAQMQKQEKLEESLVFNEEKLYAGWYPRMDVKI